MGLNLASIDYAERMAVIRGLWGGLVKTRQKTLLVETSTPLRLAA